MQTNFLRPVYKAPPKLTVNEFAVAVLVFCATTDRDLPDGVDKTLDAINPDTLKTPYRELITAYQNRPSDWVLAEIEVIYLGLLEQTIREQRAANKDWTPKKGDIYDKAGI
jgi:hypothetical protein